MVIIQLTKDQLAPIFENFHDGINLFDLKTGKYIYMNPEQVALTGFTAEELNSVSAEEVYERTHPDDRHIIIEQQKKIAAGEDLSEHVEYRCRVKSGEYRWFSDSRKLVKDEKGQPVALVGISQDITERKKTEEALKESERKFKTLAENAPDAIMRFDKDLRVLYLNPNNLSVTGKRLEDFLGKTNEEMGMPEELCKLWNGMFERAKISREVQTVEFDFSSTAGLRTFSLRVAPEFDDSGALVTYMGISHDMTERRKLEIALKKLNDDLDTRVQERTKQIEFERKRLFNVLEAIPAMVILLTPDHKVAFTNRSFRERFGEPNGRHCYDFCFGYKEPCSFCESYKVLETGKPHHWQVDAPDGRVIDAYNFPFKDMDGTKMVLEMDLDITEQKKLEKTLKDNERLAAIGATAGMVGHDIRNPLQAITGDIYLLKDALTTIPDNAIKEEMTESLDEIEKNISYINKIVADLQDYSRRITPELKVTNLYELVINSFRTIVIPQNISPSIEIDGKINLKTDITLFTRILTNLVINAIQAMPEGGELSIAASNRQGKMVLSVKDTGVGIPEAVKPRLFTPMTTTKSKGQGLGLAVVKRLVEALNGAITFESKEGKGTKFTVELPASMNA